MTRLAFLAALAAALAGVVFFELRPAPDGDGGAGTGGAQSSERAQPPPPSPAVVAADRQRWAELVLARPLFNPSRRPIVEEAKPVEASATPAAAAAADLPRVSGIILLPGRSRAIFAGAGDGKPVTVTEGDRFGPYVVEAIEPGQVRLSGPDGTRLLRPSFDPNVSAQAAVPTR
jgi:hypothetical protein